MLPHLVGFIYLFVYSLETGSNIAEAGPEHAGITGVWHCASLQSFSWLSWQKLYHLKTHSGTKKITG